MLDIVYAPVSNFGYRITAAWCKKHNVPIEKIFAKTLLNKCKFLLLALTRIITDAYDSVPWAMEIDEDWKF